MSKSNAHPPFGVSEAQGEESKPESDIEGLAYVIAKLNRIASEFNAIGVFEERAESINSVMNSLNLTLQKYCDSHEKLISRNDAQVEGIANFCIKSNETQGEVKTSVSNLKNDLFKLGREIKIGNETIFLNHDNISQVNTDIQLLVKAQTKKLADIEGLFYRTSEMSQRLMEVMKEQKVLANQIRQIAICIAVLIIIGFFF